MLDNILFIVAEAMKLADDKNRTENVSEALLNSVFLLGTKKKVENQEFDIKGQVRG